LAEQQWQTGLPITCHLDYARWPVPAPARNRHLDISIHVWRSRGWEQRDEAIEAMGGRVPRGTHTERRRVDVLDGVFAFVRYFVTVNPTDRHLIVQGVYLPASSLGRRIPFATYERVVRHAIALADEGHLRIELRNGKLRLLGEDEPIVLGPLPPRQQRYREPRSERRKRLELDQVAAIYLAHPRAPTEAVARETNVSLRTASRRVADAREAGLLAAPSASRRS
jgi:hypothetical protein